MSIRIMTWVWDHAAVSSSELLLLLAIADHADDDGGNAWPSVARLAARTRVSTRTVQRLLTRLEDRGLLVIERPDGRRSTNRYTVIMTASPNPATRRTGDNPDFPVDDHSSAVDKGATICHPDNLSGVTSVHDPRQNVTPPLTLLSPKPSLTIPNRPGPRGSPAGTQDSAKSLDSSETVELAVRRMLAGLGPGWSLSPRDTESLVPLARAAVESGWTVEALTAALTAGASHVRSPVGVLRARLDGLRRAGRVDTSGVVRAGTAHCGKCDETHHRENAEGQIYRCPECHPLAAPQGPSP